MTHFGAMELGSNSVQVPMHTSKRKSVPVLRQPSVTAHYLVDCTAVAIDYKAYLLRPKRPFGPLAKAYNRNFFVCTLALESSSFRPCIEKGIFH